FKTISGCFSGTEQEIEVIAIDLVTEKSMSYADKNVKIVFLRQVCVQYDDLPVFFVPLILVFLAQESDSLFFEGYYREIVIRVLLRHFKALGLFNLRYGGCRNQGCYRKKQYP